MSYSRNYNATVSGSYHKTVSVSYPPSKDGGSTSVTVSGTVDIPVDIEIYVDTDKFDDNVGHCRNSVLGLNTAVVATTAAEIDAKNRASKKIGNTIVKGFFDYITSELSQLKSELSTKCDSILATMLEQKGACIEKSEQMSTDYKRISSRYFKLFTDLDNELSTRIKAIDKPIFGVNRDLLECTSRKTDTSLLGISTICAAETAQLDAILAASSIKNRAKKLISKTTDFLSGTYMLKKSIQDMLLNNDGGDSYMLPVIYVESTEESKSIKRRTYGTEALPLKGLKNLDVEFTTKFQDETIAWGAADREFDEHIDSYFNQELSSAHLDPRTAQVIMELRSRNKINVVKNARA